MTDHDDTDLGARLALLTDARPEPPDPAAGVRARIKRRRRRRTGLALAGTATLTAAAVLTAPALLGTFAAGREPGVAGFGPATVPSARPAPTASEPTTTTAEPSTATGLPSAGRPTAGSSGDHKKILPRPWSARKFTKLPDANAYRPAAYYVAQGTIPTGSWAVLAYSGDACVTTDEGQAGSFGRPHLCPGNLEDNYLVVPGRTREKSATRIDHTMVLGVAPITARKVRITYTGGSTLTDAVATPATETARFFGVVIPQRDLRNVKVTPVP